MLFRLIYQAYFYFQRFSSHVLLRQDDLEGLDPLQNLYSTRAGYSLTLFKHHVDDDLLRDLVIYRKLLPKLASTRAKQPLYIRFDMSNSSLLQQDLAGNVDA